MAVNNIRIQKLHIYNKFFLVMPDRQTFIRAICNGGTTYERETHRQIYRQDGRETDDQEFMTEDKQADRHDGKTTDTQEDTLADSKRQTAYQCEKLLVLYRRCRRETYLECL
jgi:hypothetical protein